MENTEISRQSKKDLTHIFLRSIDDHYHKQNISEFYEIFIENINAFKEKTFILRSSRKTQRDILSINNDENLLKYIINKDNILHFLGNYKKFHFKNPISELDFVNILCDLSISEKINLSCFSKLLLDNINFSDRMVADNNLLDLLTNKDLFIHSIRDWTKEQVNNNTSPNNHTKDNIKNDIKNIVSNIKLNQEHIDLIKKENIFSQSDIPHLIFSPKHTFYNDNITQSIEYYFNKNTKNIIQGFYPEAENHVTAILDNIQYYLEQRSGFLEQTLPITHIEETEQNIANLINTSIQNIKLKGSIKSENKVKKNKRSML